MLCVQNEQILRGVSEKRRNNVDPSATAFVRPVGHVELVQLGTGKGPGQPDQAGPKPARGERAENAMAQLQLGGRFPGTGEFDDHRGREP